MRRLRFSAAIFSIPLAGAFMIGCSSSEDSSRDMPPTGKVAKKSGGSSTKEKTTSSSDGAGATASGGSGGSGATGATELEAKGSGTIKGTVVFDGNPPAATPVKMEKDPEVCNKTDQKKLQVWEVGPNKGVANVVVWLRAPKGKAFKIPDDMKQWKGDPVTIDQPHCAFEPRVVTIFPSFFDPQAKEQKPSGQKFVVANSAPITHNTNVTPSSTLINQGGNNILQSKSKQEMVL